MARDCTKWCEKIITEDKVAQAIRVGHNTVREIAKDLGIHTTTVARNLKIMYDAGFLTRHKRGYAYIYDINEVKK